MQQSNEPQNERSLVISFLVHLFVMEEITATVKSVH